LIFNGAVVFYVSLYTYEYVSFPLCIYIGSKIVDFGVNTTNYFKKYNIMCVAQKSLSLFAEPLRVTSIELVQYKYKFNQYFIIIVLSSKIYYELSIIRTNKPLVLLTKVLF